MRAGGARGAPSPPGRSPDGNALRAQIAPAAGDASDGAPALASACLAVLDGWGRRDAAPPAELGRELLLGGWLAQHYLMCAPPARAVQSLRGRDGLPCESAPAGTVPRECSTRTPGVFGRAPLHAWQCCASQVLGSDLKAATRG